MHPSSAIRLRPFFSPGGQPGGELAPPGGRGFGGGGAQRPGAHHDALAVVLHHQQHIAGGGRGQVRGVVGVRVCRGGHRELPGLALADPQSGGAGNGRGGLIEGPARGLDRGQPGQPAGLLLLWQVQHRVGRIQVRRAAAAVRHPGHRDLANTVARPRSCPRSVIPRLTWSEPVTGSRRSSRAARKSSESWCSTRTSSRDSTVS
jgi:hypothetical protein